MRSPGNGFFLNRSRSTKSGGIYLMPQADRERQLGDVQHICVCTGFPLLDVAAVISPRQGPCRQTGPPLSSEERTMARGLSPRVSRNKSSIVQRTCCSPGLSTTCLLVRAPYTPSSLRSAAAQWTPRLQLACRSST